MYLKSMTLKGFKSFASPTTLSFEPGVTCVVGPNGSGKSNVVDALSWVMGEQGAKSLRGGKMEDVVFAGTSQKAALGRAEVSLTIDNSDQALPIDFTEVTISRIMFRSGGSEYAINGSPCRLLDVQELLSDSGIGREMHVIVGQGQLDSILHATPEDRRGFVEEAAGVLKHRKRKEKALRKLGSLSDKMSRLTDLTSELRRQLKPLGRQAEVARRAVVIQSDVRDSRLRLLADDLAALNLDLAKEQADEVALKERKSEVEAQMMADQASEAALIAESEEAVASLSAAQSLWFKLSGLVERFRAVESVATERSRNLAAHAADMRSGSVDPQVLDRQAKQISEQEQDLSTLVRERRQALTECSAARSAAEAAVSNEEQRVEAAATKASDSRERVARLNGLVVAARTKLEAREAEVERSVHSLESRKQRADAAAAEFQEQESQVALLDNGEVDLDGHYEQADSKHALLMSELAELKLEHSEKKNARDAANARIEALTAGLDARRETPKFVTDMPGVGRAIVELLRVEPGLEKALTAVLGDIASALLADSMVSAREAIERLHAEGGTASFVISTDPLPPAKELDWSGSVGRSLEDCVTMPDPIQSAIRPLLANVVVVSDLDEAQLALEQGADKAVTLTGDTVSQVAASGGEPSGSTVLELAVQIESAQQNCQDLEIGMDRLRFAIEKGETAVHDAKGVLDQALSELHASDAQMAAVADRLGALGSELKAARAETDRLSNTLSTARQAVAEDSESLEVAIAKLAAAERERPENQPPLVDRREELSADVARLRATEMETRLLLRTDEERLHVLHSRIEQLRQAAAKERRDAQDWELQQQRRRRQAAVADAVLIASGLALKAATALAGTADAERVAGEQRRTEREQELSVLRSRLKTISSELDQLTSSVHRDEMLRTEQRVRIQQIEEKTMEEFGIEPHSLIEEYGPDVMVPPSLRAPGDEEDGLEDREAYPYVRREQERRLRSAERAMKLLGRVNPLALEEFAAMEERHKFLSEQVEDLKKSAADLQSIIAGVDERVEQVFAEAFADTAREFERIFSRLFPGGDGRLILTDPADMLATGIEVEARPPGKKIKRLSLLSGGERSLTAVAFLVALFKARPSPFYVLDEVEAALDDVNLGRLLEVIDELRQDSQLIVITHQKRTMEVADALYGITMRGDGVSRVISQRVNESEPTKDPEASFA